MEFGVGSSKNQMAGISTSTSNPSWSERICKRNTIASIALFVMFIIAVGKMNAPASGKDIAGLFHNSKGEDSQNEMNYLKDNDDDDDDDADSTDIDDNDDDDDESTVRSQKPDSKKDKYKENKIEKDKEQADLLVDIKNEPAQCKAPKKFLVPEENNPRIVLLTSYPGSGNTWARHLIQESTRVYTGSAYFDKKILATFPGEAKRDGSVIVVKTHYPCGGCWLVGIPNSYLNREVRDHETGPVPGSTTVVYILRSPFDALLAEFNRMISHRNHTGLLTPEMMEFNKIHTRWFRFIEKRVPQWLHHVDYYLKNDVRGKNIEFPPPNKGLKNVMWTDEQNRPVHVIFYEQLVAHPALEIKKLVEWLQPIFKKDELPSPEMAGICAHFNQTGSYKRDHSKIYNPYTEDQKKKICEAVKRVWHEDVWGPCDGRLQIERRISNP